MMKPDFWRELKGQEKEESKREDIKQGEQKRDEERLRAKMTKAAAKKAEEPRVAGLAKEGQRSLGERILQDYNEVPKSIVAQC